MNHSLLDIVKLSIVWAAIFSSTKRFGQLGMAEACYLKAAAKGSGQMSAKAGSEHARLSETDEPVVEETTDFRYAVRSVLSFHRRSVFRECRPLVVPCIKEHCTKPVHRLGQND